MKNNLLRTATLFGTSLMLAINASAQDPKIKTDNNEYKYKSEQLKIKQDKNELKIKGEVQPLEYRRSVTEISPINSKDAGTLADKAVVTTPKKRNLSTSSRKVAKKTAYAGNKRHYAKTTKICTCKQRTVARKSTNTRRTYAARPRIIRDTVFTAQPETRIATIYERDTVLVTKVDTVYKFETQSSWSGNRTPRIDYKKLKLKKDGDEIQMKKKLEDGQKVKQKFESESEYNTYKQGAE